MNHHKIQFLDVQKKELKNNEWTQQTAKNAMQFPQDLNWEETVE